MALLAVMTATAKKKEYPRADIKVGYTYHETFVRGSDGIIERDIPFVLLATTSNQSFTILRQNTKTRSNQLHKVEH